jgi:hypothetical protein
MHGICIGVEISLKEKAPLDIGLFIVLSALF